MSLYYVLNEENYKGKREEIGNIMLSFAQKLYNETGLSLELYVGPTKEKINHFYKHQGMEILTEEVLWRNMNYKEKANKFVEYLKNIGAENGDLLIIDPYFFPKNSHSEYIDLVTDILNKTSPKSITVITDKKNYDEKVFHAVNNKLFTDISLNFSEEWHDRFWIANRTKGFVVGTSFNGVGKKISLIAYLDQDDVKEIVNYISV